MNWIRIFNGQYTNNSMSYSQELAAKTAAKKAQLFNKMMEDMGNYEQELYEQGIDPLDHTMYKFKVLDYAQRTDVSFNGTTYQCLSGDVDKMLVNMEEKSYCNI